jgi:uncharacterized protein HemX
VVPALTTAVFVAPTGTVPETAVDTEPAAPVDEILDEIEETAETEPQPDPAAEALVEDDSLLNPATIAIAAALAILLGAAGYAVWQRRQQAK